MSKPLKIASIDWAHTKPLTYHINSELYGEIEFEKLIDFLKSKEITTIVGENLPTKLLLPLLESKFEIHRCSGSLTSKYREENNLEKTDSIDAKSILEQYILHSELFYQYTEKDKQYLRAKALYKFRDSLLKTRVQYGNKIEMCSKYNIFDQDILDRLKRMHKELLSDQLYLDTQFGENDYFKKYIRLFDDIKGVGNVTVAEVVSEIGNINRFPTQSKFMSYVFGYNGNNHCNHNLKIRFLMSVDNMLKSKNEKYSKLYHDYKEQLKLKHPEKIKLDGKTKYNPNHLTNLTRRRVAREIAKLFYKRLKEYSEKDSGIPKKEKIEMKKIQNTIVI